MESHDELRQRILRGESITREELRAAIEKLRGERVKIALNSVAKRQATKGASDDELDADLNDIFDDIKKEKGL
jgi:hypothetical protein